MPQPVAGQNCSHDEGPAGMVTEFCFRWAMHYAVFDKLIFVPLRLSARRHNLLLGFRWGDGRPFMLQLDGRCRIDRNIARAYGLWARLGAAQLLQQ
jgi:hypothetical protein